MPINVRDILLPFATDMGSAKIHRLDWLKENDVLLHMSITKVTGVIYDDGNHSISVPSWSYNSTASVNEGAADFPSTGLVVRKDQMVRVDWHNDVDKNDAESPVDEVSIEYNDGDNLVPQNTLGTNNAEINAHKAQARFVTHLHGGRVAPSYDGWPESVAGPNKLCATAMKTKSVPPCTGFMITQCILLQVMFLQAWQRHTLFVTPRNIASICLVRMMSWC